jgi:hypothetical protein
MVSYPGGDHMSITLSQSTQLYLRDIANNHNTGRACLDDLVTQTKCQFRQLEGFLHNSNSYLMAFDAAQNYLPTKERPVYSSTLAYTHYYRITLIGIPKNTSIPLHDHPNMVSIVVFLSGRIHSPIYRLVSKDCGYNLAELENCSEQTYSQNDITVLTPHTGNLHSMEALTAKAVYLSIQISKSSSFSKQSYYFPAVPIAAESKRSLWFSIPFRMHPDEA